MVALGQEFERLERENKCRKNNGGGLSARPGFAVGGRVRGKGFVPTEQQEKERGSKFENDQISEAKGTPAEEKEEKNLLEFENWEGMRFATGSTTNRTYSQLHTTAKLMSRGVDKKTWTKCQPFKED